MGSMSRRKGAVAELEVRDLLRARGYDSHRTAPLQAAQDSPHEDVDGLPGFFLEVRRREAVRPLEWLTETEERCPKGKTPLLVYRRSRTPWTVSLRLDHFLDLLEDRRNAADLLQDAELD